MEMRQENIPAGIVKDFEMVRTAHPTLLNKVKPIKIVFRSKKK